MRNKRNATIAAVVSVVVFVVAGWLLLRGGASYKTFPLNTLNPRGAKAEIIQGLLIKVMVIAGVVFIVVESGLLWLVHRFKDRPGEGEEPVQVHGKTGLELAWTAVPAFLLAVLAVFNVQGILKMQQAGDNPMKVYVVGQQWWWEYRYDTNDDGKVDIITANQMVIPAGRNVKLLIQSNDVIHSFWIPALNGKKDAVPGYTNPLVMQAFRPGVFEGQCTEFCGLSHGLMRMQVKALSKSDYAEWVDRMTSVPDQPSTEIAKAGQALFIGQCASCHQIDGLTPDSTAPFKYSEEPDPSYGKTHNSPLLAKNAPNLTHLMMRDTFAASMLDLYTKPATPVVMNKSAPNVDNIKRWLRNPADILPMDPANGQGMPTLGLSETQIDQLTAYLLTLK